MMKITQTEVVLSQLEAKLGQPQSQIIPSEEQISCYEGVLPETLLNIWRTWGWCCLGEGRFWFVNPSENHELLTAITKDNPDFHYPNENFVISRSAFGVLNVWNKTQRILFEYDPICNWFVNKTAKKGDVVDLLEHSFVSDIEQLNLNLWDVADFNGKYIFKYALKKLGPLNSDEIYGFPPELSRSDYHWRNVIKVNLFTHLLAMNKRQTFSFPTL